MLHSTWVTKILMRSISTRAAGFPTLVYIDTRPSSPALPLLYRSNIRATIESKVEAFIRDAVSQSSVTIYQNCLLPNKEKNDNAFWADQACCPRTEPNIFPPSIILQPSLKARCHTVIPLQ